jgi:signal transduction histidine kinase/ligand-binding sensor domain-containing protein
MLQALAKSIVGVESKRLTGFYLAIVSLVVLFSGPARAEQLPIKTYTIADGLAHGSIVSIYQDHKGFLWFGTYEGLNRFDGYSFVTYDRRDGLPQVFINHITEDRQGRLWVATNGGAVARLADHWSEQGSAKFVSFTIRDTNDPLVKRANYVNRMVFDGRGNLWCLTDSGLYRAVVDDSQLQFEAIIEKDTFGSNAAFEDADGTLWFGIGDTLVEIRGSEILHHGSIDGVSNKTGIFGIVRDAVGHLLVADAYRVFEFVPPSPGNPRGEWRRYLTPPHQPAQSPQQLNSIRTLLVDDTGALWLGTLQGLVRYADGKVSRYTVVNGLPNDQVRALAIDRAGNLWMATAGGVCQLISLSLVSYTRSEGLPLNTISVYEDEGGSIWAVLADGSLAEIGGKSLFRERLASPLIATASIGLVYSNKIWYRLNQGSGVKIDKPRLRLSSGREVDLAGYVSTDAHLYKDERGSLWMARADHNLYRLDFAGNGTPTVERFPTDADYGVTHTLMMSDGKGSLWLGTWEKMGRLRDGRYASIEPAVGLPETDPRAFFLDSRGWLWVGLRYQGVSVTREPAAANPIFINYSHEQGQLSSNAVRSIAEDQAGKIYFGTDRGLDRFDPSVNQWTHFTTEDGLAGNIIYKVLSDRNGFVWVASEGGVSRFDPRKEKKVNHPPPIYFSHLQVAGEAVRLAESGIESIPARELTATQNNLTIAFVAPTYQNVSELLYQYKLEGLSLQWSAPTPERSVTFGSLAPGEYRFLVRAVGKNGVTSPQMAVFEFRILPPIYLRWWFIAASLLLAGLAIYSFYRLRVSRLLEMERTRTRIAADLHDDIGANLTKISILTEVAHQQLGLVNKVADDTLLSIATISRESAASMRDIIWAINPKRDRLLDLSRRMRGFATDIFTSRDIEFRFSVADGDQELKLGPEMRRDIFLIFKEAINNIVRHAECKKAEIELYVKHQQLVLRVSDDGKGFLVTENGDGHGFTSMRRRAENCGGGLEIISHPGRGTTIRLIVPGRRWR